MATSLPQSQGSLYGSVTSDAEGRPLATVQEGHLPAADLSEGVQPGGKPLGSGPAGRETAQQPGFPSDRQRREGNLSYAPQLRLPPPPQPVPQLQTGMTIEDRLAALEGMMVDVRDDLQAIRNEMQNILRAAKEASEESQQVALRVDNLEFEWLNWNENQHLGAASPEQQYAEESET